MQTVVLHQWEASPFCMKVRKVLRHKNIGFTVVNYNGVMGCVFHAKRTAIPGQSES